MTTDYNQGHTAELYQQAKQQLWRSLIETPSLLKLIGEVRGKNVVDVACGEGHVARLLRQSGAAEVLGFDISERMIELARIQERQHPLGIEYRVEDARSIATRQDFDLAVSAWLLVYAHDRVELGQMCRGLASRLRPGGRFVTFTTNPNLYSFQPLPDYRKYGFEIKLADSVWEGAPIQWKLQFDGASLDIENYYLPVADYESALIEAGFREFRVHQPELASNGAPAEENSFWKTFLDFPPAILIDCVKA